eukprot:snap_masked-scaffold_26-processed-gene-4.132-mRNA-1 protein AED:1.00 eAED:1.00 QI:0/0/0/0/1/1/2/0/415
MFLFTIASNAFLNAKLDKFYYYYLPMKLRKLFPDKIWKSSQAIYGLKEAPLFWCNEITKTLEQLEFTVNLKERTLFYHKNKNILALLYVDDILFGATEQRNLNWVLSALKRQYEVKNTLNIDNYVGFEIDQGKKHILLTATGYIEKIAESFEVVEDENVKTPHIVNKYIDQELQSKPMELKRKFQSLVGSLTYISRVCRPDIAFQTNMLAQQSSKPLISHLNAGKRVIKYLLNTKFLGLKYLKGAEKYEIEAFSDASYATLCGRHSVSGYVFKVNKSVILFKTRKQKLVSTSSTEAEILVCSLLIKELKWMKINLEFLNVKLNKVTLYTDNKGAVNKLSLKKSFSNIKQLDIEYYFCKKILEEEKWTLKYIKREKNEADALTRPVERNWFLTTRKNWMNEAKVVEESGVKGEGEK